MITSLLAPITHNDEALKGIRRSRFSFHFTAARRRRWLLVQLVTSPAISGDRPQRPTPQRATVPTRADYGHLLDNFQADRIASRCF